MSDETWFVVCDQAGNSVSVGTVVADPLPVGFSAIALNNADAELLRAGAGVWDSASLAVVAVGAPIPASVSARQIRLWLVRHGISLADVDAAIAAIPEAQQREETRVEWDYAPYVERTHPLLLPLAQALGLNEEQVDQAFREASTL